MLQALSGLDTPVNALEGQAEDVVWERQKAVGSRVLNQPRCDVQGLFEKPLKGPQRSKTRVQSRNRCWYFEPASRYIFVLQLLDTIVTKYETKLITRNTNE